MTATPADLRDFARTMAAQSRWTPDIQAQLMDLIRPVAMATRGQIIPPNNRTVAIDNLYRCKPTGWLRVDQETPGFNAFSHLQLWRQDIGDAAVNLKVDIVHYLGCPTLALAMVATTAEAWAWLAENPGN